MKQWSLAELSRKMIQRGKQEGRMWLLPVGLLALVYILGISAILRADFNYIDDMGRITFGYQGWDNFSRYISNLLSTFLHTGRYLNDISPLPQLLAALILAVAGVAAVRVVTGRETLTVWEYAAVLPMGLSPYFLECFSYKYDAPYMALSVLAGVCPLLLCRKDWRLYLLGSVAGILVVCTTYQPATGIFPMFVLFLAMRRWHHGEKLGDIFRFVGFSVAGYGVGLVVFRVFLMRVTEEYVSGGIPALSQLIPHTVESFCTYFHLIFTDFRREWLLVILALCVAFLYVQVRDSSRNKVGAAAVSVVALGLGLLCSFGLYPVLEEALYAPRAMYGFGVWLALVAVFTVTTPRSYWCKLVSMGLAWIFFVFAFTYGNTLTLQKNYTEFRIEQAIDDLTEAHVLEGDTRKTVQVSGTIGYAPVFDHMPQDYQMLKRLVPVPFGGGVGWNSYLFAYFYGLEEHMTWAGWDTELDLTEKDLPVVVDNLYHTIRADEAYVLIELKE